jgi:Tat protein secretion system quality control protein TatD with DNase activity
VDKLLVVGGYAEDTIECMEIIADIPNAWTTVGVHPTRSSVSNIFKAILDGFQKLQQC